MKLKTIIRKRRLEGIEHLLVMDEGRISKRVLDVKPEGRIKGRPMISWSDTVEDDLRLIK